MIHTKNEALNTDAVFFDAARLKKNNKKEKYVDFLRIKLYNIRVVRNKYFESSVRNGIKIDFY